MSIDEDASSSDFAYGTLTEHVEIGEERFSVELTARPARFGTTFYAFSSLAASSQSSVIHYARYLAETDSPSDSKARHATMLSEACRA